MSSHSCIRQELACYKSYGAAHTSAVVSLGKSYYGNKSKCSPVTCWLTFRRLRISVRPAGDHSCDKPTPALYRGGCTWPEATIKLNMVRKDTLRTVIPVQRSVLSRRHQPEAPRQAQCRGHNYDSLDRQPDGVTTAPLPHRPPRHHSPRWSPHITCSTHRVKSRPMQRQTKTNTN